MCHLSVVCLIASRQAPRSRTVSVTVTAAYQICPVQSIAPCASSPLSSGVTRGREAQGAVAAPPGAASEGSQNTHSHFIASSPGRRRHVSPNCYSGGADSGCNCQLVPNMRRKFAHLSVADPEDRAGGRRESGGCAPSRMQGSEVQSFPETGVVMHSVE